jgi:2'-5' RNA ligase
MRCFIAFSPDLEIKNKLFYISNEFNKVCKSKNVEIQNIHLTFFFWQNLEDKKITDLIYSIEKLKFKQFVSSKNYLNIFYRNNMPSSINFFIKDENLLKLRKELEYNLTEKNIIFDTRKFKPHITLLRIKYIENMLKFKIKFNELKDNFNNIDICVNNIILYQSKLTSKGPIYKELYKYNLK